MKTFILISFGLLAIPVGAATISSGTVETCFSDTCLLNSQNLTASFDVSGSSLTNVTFHDLKNTLSIPGCQAGVPTCSYTINSTFTDTTASGPVFGSVVYNGTTYSTDVNNVLTLTLTATAGPLPGTVTSVNGPFSSSLPAYVTTTASGAFTMTGSITLVSFGNTIFTESLTGTGQVSIDQREAVTVEPTFKNSVFTFATPEPASSVLMSSGFAALFLGVVLKRRGVNRTQCSR